MKISILISLFIVATSNLCFPQNKKELKKAHERMLDTLQQKISGVKYAEIRPSRKNSGIAINENQTGDAAILQGVKNYLKNLGLEIIIDEQQRARAINLSKTKSDFVIVDYHFGEFNSKLGAIGNYPFYFEFKFCDGSRYSFTDKALVNGYTNYSLLILNTCQFNFPLTKGYKLYNKLMVRQNPLILNRINFEKYLDTNNNKKSKEGLFKILGGSSFLNTNYTIGIINQNDSLKFIYIDGAEFSSDWNEGELIGILEPTMSENDYITTLNIVDKSTESKGIISFLSNNSFELRITDLNGEKSNTEKFIRIK